jgi:hypothetical protein
MITEPTLTDIISLFFKELWLIFTSVNGSATGSMGINICLGMFFSLFLFITIKMRTTYTMVKRHIVALSGAFILFLRYFLLMMFDWGYHIGLYSNKTIYFLFPPIEHYFYMLALGCFAYYSLSHYDYYPGLLRKIIWGIPIFTTIFFIYSTIVWKNAYYSHDDIITFTSSIVDWQKHLLVSIMAFYLFCVSIYRYKRHDYFLSGFWTLVLITEMSMFSLTFDHNVPTVFNELFKAMQIWLIPFLTLHFIKDYVRKIKCYYVNNCDKMIEFD